MVPTKTHSILTRTTCRFRGGLSVKNDSLRALEAESFKTGNINDLNASGDYGVGNHNALDMHLNGYILVHKEGDDCEEFMSQDGKPTLYSDGNEKTDCNKGGHSHS